MAVNLIILALLIFAIIKQIKIAKLQQTGGGYRQMSADQPV